MKIISTITKRELSAFFTSPIAYVYLLAFLVVTNWLFFRGFFLVGQADLRPLFGIMPWIFLFFVPAVAMGKWAEERRLGTHEILFTLPVSTTHIALAKFFSGLLLIALAVLLTLPMAISAALLGPLDWGQVIGSYMGTLFMGGAYLAMGLFVSSCTENQIVAFIVGVLLCFFFFVLGTPLTTWSHGSLWVSLLEYLGMATHFEAIARGVIDSRDIIYYLSLISFFLFVNVKVLEGRART